MIGIRIFVYLFILMISNPFYVGKLIERGVITDNYLLTLSLLLLFFFSCGAFFLLLIKERLTVIEYFKVNYKNYILLLLVIISSLAIAEIILRAREAISRKQVHYVHHYEVDYRYRRNSFGFRDDEFKKIKGKNTFRVFLLGDSIVEGVVNEDDTFDKLLEKRCKEDNLNCEVYNLAIDGAGPSFYRRVAKRFQAYQPDLIVVSVYVDNDIEKSDYFKIKSSTRLLHVIEKIMRCIKRDSMLLNMIKEILQKRELRKWIQRAQLGAFYKELLLREEINPWQIKRAGVDNQEYYDFMVKLFHEDPAFRDYILAIKQLYKNTSFLLLINPSKYQVNIKYFDSMRKIGFVFKENKAVDRKIQDAIISWAVQNGIDYLDILPYMLQSQNGSFYYEIDDHYNALGNKFVIDKLYDTLKERGMLKKGERVKY